MQALGGNCRTTLLVAASSCAQHAAKALEGTWPRFVFWTGASCKLCILWVAKPLQRTLEAQRGVHIKFIPLITRPSNYHPANLCSCSASAPRMKLFLLYVLPPEQRVLGPEILEKHGSWAVISTFMCHTWVQVWLYAICHGFVWFYCSIPCLLSHVHPKLFRVCQGSKCCEGTSTQIALFVGVWRFCKGLYCPEIFEILFLSILLALAGSVSLSLVASWLQVNYTYSPEQLLLLVAKLQKQLVGAVRDTIIWPFDNINHDNIMATLPHPAASCELLVSTLGGAHQHIMELGQLRPESAVVRALSVRFVCNGNLFKTNFK